MNVVITANSPGEVASWLRPVVEAFGRLAPEARIRVCLTPCTFATGAEEQVVRSIPGVTSVYRPSQTVAWALWGRRPADMAGEGSGPGVVLFLGGDPFYAVLLGRRTRWPAAAYTEGRAPWKGAFRRYFVAHEPARQRVLQQGVAPERVTVTGDLMLDGLTLRWAPGKGRARLGLGEGPGPVIGLFPGSRRHELHAALPFFLRTAAQIAAWRPGARFAVAVSPFVTPQLLAAALGAGGLFSPPADKLTGALFGEGGADGYPWSPEHRSAWVEWVAGTEGEGPAAGARAVRVLLVRGAAFDVAAASDAVLTIPGSNTAELAGLGVPMVVVLSLDHLQDVPLEGLPGLLSGVPWLGSALRRRALERLDRRMPFLAWPNRRAGRMLVPELRKSGLTPKEVAQAVLDLVDDGERREALSRALRDVMGERGAAERIARECLELALAAPGKGSSARARSRG